VAAEENGNVTVKLLALDQQAVADMDRLVIEGSRLDQEAHALRARSGALFEEMMRLRRVVTVALRHHRRTGALRER
jgi:ABC-type uncharacterized transport system involved in gliding motility auxiliary subunit